MAGKKKFIVTGVLATVLLVGSIGGVALAQVGKVADSPSRILLTSDNASQTKTLLARVAEKLGISQQELEDAFAQARSEMRDEALDRYLQKLIDEGKITQEQADQYKAWLQARPDFEPFQQALQEWREAKPDVPLAGHFGHFRGHGFRGGMMGGRGGFFRGW